MTVIELKEKLIAKINDTDNEEILDYISDLFEYVYKEEEVHKLSPDELEAVNEGIEQIEKGLFYTNDEANEIFNKCLGK